MFKFRSGSSLDRMGLTLGSHSVSGSKKILQGLNLTGQGIGAVLKWKIICGKHAKDPNGIWILNIL